MLQPADPLAATRPTDAGEAVHARLTLRASATRL